MTDRLQQRLVAAYVLLLVPVAWLAMRYDRYAIDGDAVSYMDIADLIRAHHWAGAVNAYWHPLYPALLCVTQVVSRTTRFSELGAYYVLNYLLFLFQVAAVLLFVRALVSLRKQLASSPSLLGQPALQLLGLSLLVLSVTRELALGKVRTDSLLQGLILLCFAGVMAVLAAQRNIPRLGYAVLTGLGFGLAYLTKSFAFLLAILSLAALVGFSRFVQKQSWSRALAPGLIGFVAFAALAGPYVAALSLQKHRFDFGDSGNLNYAWYVSGTEKMHLEPWMRDSFGSATVHLLHPERQVLAQPGVYSYKALPFGTYPPWFDSSYFNEHISPKFNLKLLIVRDRRNVELIVRYLLNHPEPLILLALLLATAATFPGLWAMRFAWPVAGLGLAMWALYSLVNVEERYVTVAYLAILLPLFAALVPARKTPFPGSSAPLAGVLVGLLALLAAGEMLREDLANRRDESVSRQIPAWRDAAIYGAAEGLVRLGLRPGDEIACIGTTACLYDHYWARLAGVRILTEWYAPEPDHLVDQLDALPNRQAVYNTLRGEGAKVLVGVFDPGEMTQNHPGAAGWQRLGETHFYALPLLTR